MCVQGRRLRMRAEQGATIMSTSADNDNPSRGRVAAAATSWPTASAGNTALAQSQPEPASLEPPVDNDMPPPETPLATTLPAVPVHASPPPASAVSPHERLHGFIVSEAASLEQLGLTLPTRPLALSAPRNTALFPGGLAHTHRGLLAPTALYEPSVDERPGFSEPTAHAAKAGKADTAPSVPSGGAMHLDQANRPHVTSQPGFLVGLIAAAMSGAGLYLYLV